MPDINLESLNHIGALGVLALFIICNTIIASLFIRLVKDHVIPMLMNHLQHTEEAYDKMSHTIARNTDILEMVADDLSEVRRRINDRKDS
jgi:hypothetical protein